MTLTRKVRVGSFGEAQQLLRALKRACLHGRCWWSPGEVVILVNAVWALQQADRVIEAWRVAGPSGERGDSPPAGPALRL